MAFDILKLEELSPFEPSRRKRIEASNQGLRARGYEDNLERMMEARNRKKEGENDGR